MNKMHELEKVSFDYVSQSTGLTRSEFVSYDDNSFSIYWFLRVNKLTSLKLYEDDINKLVSNGFLVSSALMHSITKLQPQDFTKMLYDECPFAVAALRVSEMKNCKSATLDSFKNVSSMWFSIQYGINNINLPSYLWWLAKEIVTNITNGDGFFMCTNLSDGVPVMQICFGRYDFVPVRGVVEYEIGNTQDPLLECASKFIELSNINVAFSYTDKVTVLYQLVHLYDIDSTWRFAFMSPIRKRLVLAYEPGDTFLDSLWKCLKEDVEWVVKPSEHLYTSTINIFDMKVDLVKYALNPKNFTDNLKGGTVS